MQKRARNVYVFRLSFRFLRATAGGWIMVDDEFFKKQEKDRRNEFMHDSRRERGEEEKKLIA